MQKTESEFLDLYYATHDALYRYTRRKIGEKPFVEDILQETYYQAYKNIEKLKSHPNPIGWLYQTANFIVKNYQRKKENRVLSLEGMMPCEKLAMTENGYALVEWKILLHNLISKDELRLLHQYYVEQRSSEEISKLLGITQENVRVKLYRIRRKMKKKINKCYESIL